MNNFTDDPQFTWLAFFMGAATLVTPLMLLLWLLGIFGIGPTGY